MRLYKFMQDKKWYEDVGHIFIGLIPMLGWLREHRQWPPGKPFYAVPANDRSIPASDIKLVTQLDRVEDSYRDFLGYAIGGTIRCAVLVGLLVWKW